MYILSYIVYNTLLYYICIGKTASLLKQTTEQSNLQKILIQIIIIIVTISSILCTIVLIFLSTQTSFVEAVSFTVVLMVASIPLAIG